MCACMCSLATTIKGEIWLCDDVGMFPLKWQYDDDVDYNEICFREDTVRLANTCLVHQFNISFAI